MKRRHVAVPFFRGRETVRISARGAEIASGRVPISVKRARVRVRGHACVRGHARVRGRARVRVRGHAGGRGRGRACVRGPWPCLRP
jgi:hypothetical protein